MGLKRKPIEGNVRRVRHVNGNIPGVMTNKANRIVAFESHQEHMLLLRWERDHTILDYGSQPERFEFLDEQANPHTYTPDYKVWRVGGAVEIHEITRSERREKPESRLREQAARRICQSRGWVYIVHSELDLPQKTEEANLLALNRYRPRACFNPNIGQATLEILQGEQKLKLLQLATQLRNRLQLAYPLIVNTLGHMLWHRMIEGNLARHLIFIDSAIDAKVIVWLPEAVKY